MRERGRNVTARMAIGHIEQMRESRANLFRRRAQLLAIHKGGEISDEHVSAFMKEHRLAFRESHAQCLFRQLDAEAGHKNPVVERRQDTRFTSMLNECYGGRSRSPTFLGSGLTRVLLPSLGAGPQAQTRINPKSRAMERGWVGKSRSEGARPSLPPPVPTPEVKGAEIVRGGRRQHQEPPARNRSLGSLEQAVDRQFQKFSNSS